MASILPDRYLFPKSTKICTLGKFVTFEHWYRRNIGLEVLSAICNLMNDLERIAYKIRLSVQLPFLINDRQLGATGGDR